MYFGQVNFGMAMREEVEQTTTHGTAGTTETTRAGTTGATQDTVRENAATQGSIVSARNKKKVAAAQAAKEQALAGTDVAELRKLLAQVEQLISVKTAQLSKLGRQSSPRKDLLEAEIFALQKQRASLIAQINAAAAYQGAAATKEAANEAYRANILARNAAARGQASGAAASGSGPAAVSIPLGTGMNVPATNGNTPGTNSTAGSTTTGGSSTSGSGGMLAREGSQTSANADTNRLAEETARVVADAEARVAEANARAAQAQADAEAAAAEVARRQEAAEADARARADADELARLQAESIAPKSNGLLWVGLGLAAKFLFF
ncbi:MAG: hypothetical protein WAV09_03305 [Minisyncoccia bacterium]